MSKKDYYQVLGVSKQAGAEEIKKAYRKLAMEYHPDRNQGNKEYEARFKEVNEAYEILKDPQKKAAYDSYGHSAFDGGHGGGHSHGGFEFTGDMSDLFSGIFGDMMGGGRAQQSNPSKGSDLRYDITISLEEAYSGVSPTIKFKTEVTCGTCNGKGSPKPEGVVTCGACKGTGRIRRQQGFFVMESTCSKCGGTGKIIQDPCITCNGAGRVLKERSLIVNIPHGIEDGTRMRLSGEGEAGLRGAPSGDLYVFVRVSQHKIFERHGDDIHCSIPLKMTTAVLGGSIDVPTISGKMTAVSISAGTQSGSQIRVKGCGMKKMKSSSYGDMIIHINVEMPVKLTQAQKDLLAKFDSESSNDTHPASAKFLDKVKNFWEGITG